MKTTEETRNFKLILYLDNLLLIIPQICFTEFCGSDLSYEQFASRFLRPVNGNNSLKTGSREQAQNKTVKKSLALKSLPVASTPQQSTHFNH